MNVLFHPYTLRSFKTTLIGVLYELLKGGHKIFLICDDKILKVIYNNNFLHTHQNLVIIKVDIFPVFSTKELILQALSIKKKLKNLIATNSYDMVILENDCMSFLSLSISSYFNKVGVPITCIQAMSEVNTEYSKSFKRKGFANKYLVKKMLRTKLIENIGFYIYLRLSYLYIHLFLPLISRLPLRPIFMSYVNANCFSGIQSNCYNIVYEKSALDKYLSYNLPPNRIELIPHPLTNVSIPLDLFLEVAEPKSKMKNTALLLIHPFFITQDDFVKTKTIKDITELFEKFKIRKVTVKPHPDMPDSYMEFFTKFFIQFNIEFVDKTSNPYELIFQSKLIIDLPPGRSTLLTMASYLSKRTNSDKIIIGLGDGNKYFVHQNDEILETNKISEIKMIEFKSESNNLYGYDKSLRQIINK